ncbi:MAG: hypothetical protein MUC29_09425 [Pyrinomonadaceae bacterium]|jgi:hypothetical protein|nr:hypothetical protein [Pyrinomonadaceae bacterium]
MKKIFPLILFICLISSYAVAQQGKGIDSQTKKINENKTVNSGSKVGKEITFGGGKTKTAERLPNPYRLNARRDVLTETIVNVLEEKKLFLDEASSKLKDGIIITQPFVFAKGAVITKNELFRFADLPNNDSVWTRGRYSLTIEIQSIDGIKNIVTVTAKIEGRTENGLGSEWVTVPSNGEAENLFLMSLAEQLSGEIPEEPK